MWYISAHFLVYKLCRIVEHSNFVILLTLSLSFSSLFPHISGRWKYSAYSIHFDFAEQSQLCSSFSFSASASASASAAPSVHSAASIDATPSANYVFWGHLIKWKENFSHYSLPSQGKQTNQTTEQASDLTEPTNPTRPARRNRRASGRNQPNATDCSQQQESTANERGRLARGRGSTPGGSLF